MKGFLWGSTWVCSSAVPSLQGEMLQQSPASLWSSAAWELQSCSDARPPKPAQRDVLAAFGHCSLSRTPGLVRGVLGCSHFPPCRGGGAWGCGGCFCCQQGNLVAAETGRRFSHGQICKAMSNHARASCAPAQDPKGAFQLDDQFIWRGRRSFSDRQ